MIIFTKKSFTSMVQNSEVFQGWFSDAIAKMERQVVSGKRIRNMRLAGHRFDSTQKPFGRVCICLEAFVHVACRIMSVRDGADKRAADLFLIFVDPEVCITLRLLAAAGDESIILTRQADTEHGDPTAWSRQCRTYRQRLLVLFGDG